MLEKRSFASLFALFMFSTISSAVAQTAAPALTPADNSIASSPANPFGFEWQAIVKPGQVVPPGNMMRTIRPFLGWNLTCDSIRNGDRSCFLETQIGSGVDAISWRIGTAKDGRNMTMLVLPPDADLGQGVKLMFGVAQVPLMKILCSPLHCITATEFTSQLAAMVSGQPTISIAYAHGGNSVNLNASMTGFLLAMRDISASVGSGAPSPKTIPSPKKNRN